MSVSAARVTVGGTATALNTDTDTTSGTSLVVTNRDTSESVDLGGADVTSGGGFELKAGESVSADLGAGEQLYAISDGTEVRVDVLRSGA